MSGFNVNCKDCDYCMLHRVGEVTATIVYRCFISGRVVGVYKNIDCKDYVKRR